MKNTLAAQLGLIALGLTVITIISCVSFINPGYVGIKVNLFGDNKGIDEKEMTVGAHVVPPWKSVYVFPIFEQNYCWEGRDGFQFQTSDGMVVHSDIGITYRINPDYVHKIFCKYRRGIDEITGVFLRNYIRDALNHAASRYKIEDLYGKSKEVFFDDIEKYVRNNLDPIGIEVERIYLIGRFHFPDAVVTALNRKIEAMQRAEQRENELREAEAEAKKAIAKAHGKAESKLLKAKAVADANALLQESLNESIIRTRMIEKWDGKLPKIVTSDGLIFNLDSLDKE